MRGVVVFVSLIELHREGNGKKREKEERKKTKERKEERKRFCPAFCLVLLLSIVSPIFILECRRRQWHRVDRDIVQPIDHWTGRDVFHSALGQGGRRSRRREGFMESSVERSCSPRRRNDSMQQIRGSDGPAVETLVDRPSTEDHRPVQRNTGEDSSRVRIRESRGQTMTRQVQVEVSRATC
jgi:hypothetical protein